MPSWSIHCAIASKINEHLYVDENLFLFGNIVADVDDNINDYGSYATHFYGTLMCDVCKGEELPDINRFYEMYKNELSNPIILGYYCHLLTDYYFNYYSYKNHWLLNENEKIIGIKLNNGENFLTSSNYFRQDTKRKDFAKYGRYLYDLGKVKFPKYDDSIIEYCKDLKPNFINQKDINVMLKKVDIFIEEAKNSDHEYTILSKDELDEIAKITTKEILNTFKELKLLRGEGKNEQRKN